MSHKLWNYCSLMGLKLTWCQENWVKLKTLDTIIQAVKNGPGVVDILYNNAAIQSKWKSIWEFSEEEWLETFRVNLFCHDIVMQCIRAGNEETRLRPDHQPDFRN